MRSSGPCPCRSGPSSKTDHLRRRLLLLIANGPGASMCIGVAAPAALHFLGGARDDTILTRMPDDATASGSARFETGS